MASWGSAVPPYLRPSDSRGLRRHIVPLNFTTNPVSIIAWIISFIMLLLSLSIIQAKNAWNVKKNKSATSNLFLCPLIFPVIFELWNMGDKAVKELVYIVNRKCSTRSILKNIVYNVVWECKFVAEVEMTLTIDIYGLDRNSQLAVEFL